MNNFSKNVNDSNISGYVNPNFEQVAHTFVENFRARSELGASCCIRIGEETVVDLWGGHTSTDKDSPWQEDTVSVVFSCTKAATALCAHLLVERGELDLSAPVSNYWPEFAQNGKEGVLVGMMLNHSAGLPAFKEPIKPNGYNDWDYMVERLEQEKPFWQPGSRNGYQMFSFGWAVGELVRRISGKSLGQFFKDELAAPLNSDFWIGIPEGMDDRIAPMTMGPMNMEAPMSSFMTEVINDPESISHLALFNSGGFDSNDGATLRAEIGGAGGVSNARGMSKLFMPFANGGAAQGKRYMAKSTIDRMSQVSMATQLDATLRVPSRFTLGFMKSMDNRKCPAGSTEGFIIGDRAFGHVGAGGSAVFADPDAKMSFAYSMNLMGSGILLNDRGQSLVDAAYQSLDYSDNTAGFWSK